MTVPAAAVAFASGRAAHMNGFAFDTAIATAAGFGVEAGGPGRPPDALTRTETPSSVTSTDPSRSVRNVLPASPFRARLRIWRQFSSLRSTTDAISA
jgi:hypothetical protein